MIGQAYTYLLYGIQRYGNMSQILQLFSYNYCIQLASSYMHVTCSSIDKINNFYNDINAALYYSMHVAILILQILPYGSL